MTSLFSPPPINDHLAHPRYRPDIDGLRALAILCVLGFHVFPEYVKGGFIGVDIFFVISGFLISSIIFGSLDQNSFSYLEFYARRIRRIFPALILVLSVGYIIGWFTLFPDEFVRLGLHIAGGAAFVANFVFWHETGYFDTDAFSKPFLHLWSLGIEEQFYIIWPLLLGFSWKRKWNFLAITVFIACISFALNVYYIAHKPETAFYAPAPRFWELMIGGILAYFMLYKSHYFDQKKNLQSTVGIILIVLGLSLVNKSSQFPGWWALFPTVGAFFLISAGPKAWCNRYILSNRILVQFGLISYPLYLWHWLLLSYSRIILDEDLSIKYRVALVCLSIVLAWLTYKLIEKPCRKPAFQKTKTMILIFLMMIFFGLGFATHEQKRITLRKFSPIISSLIETSKGPQDGCMDVPYNSTRPWFCHLGNHLKKPIAFVYGDSHAYHLIPAFRSIAQEKNVDILLTANSGCPPLLDIYVVSDDQDVRNCHMLNDRIFNYVEQNKIPNVFLVARWSFYTDGEYNNEQALRPLALSPLPFTQTVSEAESRQAFIFGLNRTIARYEKLGVKVYLIEDDPRQLNKPNVLFRMMIMHPLLANPLVLQHIIDEKSVPVEMHKKLQAFSHFAFEQVISKQNVTLINLDSIYCNKINCPIAIGDVSMYEDNDHLSVPGAMRIKAKLQDIMLK